MISQEAIIEKAYSKLSANQADLPEQQDITVDMEDSSRTTHSYVVTFKKNTSSGSPLWSPLEINEISSL